MQFLNIVLLKSNKSSLDALITLTQAQISLNPKNAPMEDYRETLLALH